MHQERNKELLLFSGRTLSLLGHTSTANELKVYHTSTWHVNNQGYQRLSGITLKKPKRTQLIGIKCRDQAVISPRDSMFISTSQAISLNAVMVLTQRASLLQYQWEKPCHLVQLQTAYDIK